MKYSKIYNYCQENGIDSKEVLDNLYNDEVDFDVDDYRFISESDIDAIQKDELSGDTYLLGCFSAWFIANIIDLPTSQVEKAQKDGSYELLGNLMLQHIDEVQEKYSSTDGYGHHFNPYNGDEENLDGYYIFRTN